VGAPGSTGPRSDAMGAASGSMGPRSDAMGSAPVTAGACPDACVAATAEAVPCPVLSVGRRCRPLTSRDGDHGPTGDPGSPSPARVAHFRILGTLGKGGMGVVYRAEDEKLRREVAIKLLQDAGSDERRQRFLREARSAAAVTHPNVAVVHAVDEVDGRIYIAMELVDGENLRDRLDRGRLDVAVARDLAEQIARGLAAAHDKGIVHRDLKPENVMITQAGVVKLLDFGLAKTGAMRPESGKTEAGLAKTETLVTSGEGRVMGTPAYMSPEQAAGKALDVRSDVFSFGIVLYEMLSGVRPFGGESTAAVLAAVLRDEPAPLQTTAGVDAATVAVVMRCLAKEPGERFDSAVEVAAALVPQAPTKTKTNTKTNGKSMVGVAAAVAIVVVVVGVAALLRGSHPVAAAPLASTSSSPSPSPDGAAPAVGLADLPASSTRSEEAKALFRKAMVAMAAGRDAIPDLDAALVADPSFASAALQRAYRGSRYARPLTAADRKAMTIAQARREDLGPRSREDDVAWTDDRMAVWARAYDVPGEPTRAQADEAISALRDLGGAPGDSWTSGVQWGVVSGDYVGESIGALLLGARQLDEAEKVLTKATRECTRRPSVRAKELLARTYEEKGDVARACQAFGEVLRTWPKPVPRSVTVEEARARAKKLGCAP